jgi:serine/threonine protein kinase
MTTSIRNHYRGSLLRDCTENNIMLDPSGMYPKGFHPIQINRSKNFQGKLQRYDRTQRPPCYYLIDFGLSRQYSSRNALDDPLRGGDKSAPEHQHNRRCNPFHTDIYHLGNLVRERLMKRYNGFEFMEDLVNAMTVADPGRRPIIEEVIRRFSQIRKSLGEFKLRSLITAKKDSTIVTAFRYTQQAVRTVQYIILQNPAIPEP